MIATPCPWIAELNPWMQLFRLWLLFCISLALSSPAGTMLDADAIDNSSIHRSFWNGFPKGILATGTGIFTAGGTQFLAQ